MFLLIIVLGIFLVVVIRSIRDNTNGLKFTFLWLVFILLSLIPILLPKSISKLLSDFGFDNPSDGLLVMSIIYISSILYYVTTTITRQARKIEELTIQLALRNVKNEF